jgi:hypothetical protein
MHLTLTRLESGTRGAVLSGSSNGIVESEMKRGDFTWVLEMAQPSYKAAWLRGSVEAGGEEWEDGAEASIQPR